MPKKRWALYGYWHLNKLENGFALLRTISSLDCKSLSIKCQVKQKGIYTVGRSEGVKRAQTQARLDDA